MGEVVSQAWWEEQGYLDGRPLEAGLWLCLTEMLFTYRVMVCTPPPWGGVQSFYCYRSLDDARRCFDAWDGVGVNPVPGWTRVHE